MSKHNFIAKALRTPRFKPQVIRAQKGKGSYNRKAQKGREDQ